MLNSISGTPTIKPSNTPGSHSCRRSMRRITAKKIAPATMPITSSMTTPIDCSTNLLAVSVATPKPLNSAVMVSMVAVRMPPGVKSRNVANNVKGTNGKPAIRHANVGQRQQWQRQQATDQRAE